MVLETRKPTGLPSWPMVLLGGREKAGKSWTALHGSSSPLVGRTLYIGVGEDDPDEYSAIPGAEFEIVVHDGTYAGIRGAVQDAVAEPMTDGKPTLIIFDSSTRAWNLIVDNAQAVANRKARGKQDPITGDYSITPDLWNAAASQWAGIITPLQRHQGPVILTARLDYVMVMRGGQPTTEKEWKMQTHKSLPFDATCVVEMHERGHFLITGVKSARVALEKPREVPNFTIPWLFDLLGLASGVGERTHSSIVADDGVEEVVSAIRGSRTIAELQAAWATAVKASLAKEPEVIEAKDVRKTELMNAGAASETSETPAAVDAPAPAEDAPSGPTAPEAAGFTCGSCGEPRAVEEGQLCEVCEADMIAAEAGDTDE